jgi:hypothetical protein
MVNKLATDSQSILQAKGRLGPDGLFFKRAMEALQFSDFTSPTIRPTT